jgi:hypothetical protein
VCCALETCPAARLRFLQKAGPCPALEWSAKENRYQPAACCPAQALPCRYLPNPCEAAIPSPAA